jgi:hypothetical protein
MVALYAARMQIKEVFRDLKSNRFGLSLEYSGTRELECLQILLLIGLLALIVLWLLGKAIELTSQHRHYQANFSLPIQATACLLPLLATLRP